MSPTIHREQGYRFFFFSREEARRHVHVYSERGEAKYWLEPAVELAMNHGLSAHDLRSVERIIGDRYDDFIRAWGRHFGS